MSAEFGPTCGRLGCTEPKVAEVEIPGTGTRAVCATHRDAVEGDDGT
ncbi:MAG: hypothetical protein RI560_03460 [Natronomonas sp.]|nr:hypothetical protein [Natronomonas sp.]MDR9380716.1 hypothetical protein [Natronomonas sp.]MDR9431525.1 hypothetical protein [Natronomonas sp.]